MEDVGLYALNVGRRCGCNIWEENIETKIKERTNGDGMIMVVHLLLQLMERKLVDYIAGMKLESNLYLLIAMG